MRRACSSRFFFVLVEVSGSPMTQQYTSHPLGDTNTDKRMARVLLRHWRARNLEHKVSNCSPSMHQEVEISLRSARRPIFFCDSAVGDLPGVWVQLSLLNLEVRLGNGDGRTFNPEQQNKKGVVSVSDSVRASRASVSAVPLHLGDAKDTLDGVKCVG